jgi:arylsulfatase A-like enzyme
MKRRDFLKTAGMSIAAFTLTGCQLPTHQQRKTCPNIIVILCDDLGYADIGCHGGEDIPTPNIDSIAQKGVHFSNGYVSAPECSPSRAGLMTGRYQQRFGHEFNIGPPPQGVLENIGLPLSEFTIADILASAGYITGAIGKWNLGTSPRFNPLKRGFHEFFGFPHGGHSYIDSQPETYNPIMRGDTPVFETQHLTDAFTRETISFIKRHRTQPFFLYLAYNAPHKPLEPPDRYTYGFLHISEWTRRAYAQMVASLDDGIGRVLAQLKKYGIEEDTIVFFLSDNGGALKYGSDNTPLQGSKSSLYEGGIRVPFMVQWPRRLTAGSIYHHPVSSLDILPTVAAAAGATLPKNRTIDGVDLIGYLTGSNKTPPHEFLFWRWGETYAIRNGDWKLVKKDDKVELFNLASDIAETRDLSKEHPDLVERLTNAYETWNMQMVQPLWPHPLHENPEQNSQHQRTNGPENRWRRELRKHLNSDR